MAEHDLNMMYNVLSDLPNNFPYVKIDKPEFKCNAAALTELCDDYTFFTPAVLYLYSPFCDAVLAKYMEEHGEVVFAHKKFETQIFDRLQSETGNNDWAHVLWAMPAEDYPSFESFVLSLALVSRHYVYKFGVQDFNVIDPLYADKAVVLSASPPLLPVKVFGVNGSETIVAMQQSSDISPPRLVGYPPSPKIVAFRDALINQGSAENAQDQLDSDQDTESNT